jgi:hypothetical protein
LALLCLGSSLEAQAPAPPSDTALTGITARGRMLVQYDIAAWHGTDAVQALKPNEQSLNSSVAHLLSNGRWEVLFGHLTASKDTFYAHYHAVQSTPDSDFTASQFPTPVALTGLERDMAAAIATALQDFGPSQRPYNSYALPATPEGIWVYLLPAQTNARVFPHGGDVRYCIVDGGKRILDKHRFHRTILDNPSPGPGAVGGYHTSFEPLPSETDVFLVLRRVPRLPETIVTEYFQYEIHVDGTISWHRAKS